MRKLLRLPRILQGTLLRAARHDCLNLAQSTAYSAMVSLFPALIVAAAVVSLLPDTAPLRFQLSAFFDRILPPDVSPLLEGYFVDSPHSPRSTHALLLAFVVSLLGASGVVATLMERWREQAAGAFVDLYSDEHLASDADDVLADFIARFSRLVADTPGARGLLAAAITAPGELPDQSWTPYVERFIARYAPDLRPARRRAAAQTYQTITFSLMVDAARAGTAMRRRLVEARSVLAGYIHQLASEA